MTNAAADSNRGAGAGPTNASRTAAPCDQARLLVRQINSEVLNPAESAIGGAASELAMHKDEATKRFEEKEADAKARETEISAYASQALELLQAANAYLQSQKVEPPSESGRVRRDPDLSSVRDFFQEVFMPSPRPATSRAHAASGAPGTTETSAKALLAVAAEECEALKKLRRFDSDQKTKVFWWTFIPAALIAWSVTNFLLGLVAGGAAAFGLIMWLEALSVQKMHAQYGNMMWTLGHANQQIANAGREVTDMRRAAEEALQARVDEIRKDGEAVAAELRRRFVPLVSAARTRLALFVDASGIVGAAWAGRPWEEWTSATGAAASIRIGSLQPSDDRVRKLLFSGTGPLEVPALLPFGNGRSVLVRYGTARKADALVAAHNLLLRLLATVPPGKLQFTLVDPLGLGQAFAPFMKLADYDDSLIGGRIWTEEKHIERRLLDLTEHTENVIQKYLRNDFATIEDYNARAGEIAEAYRVIVVVDFPANFNESMARRLVSIAEHGPRCGVYAVVLMDESKPLPYGFSANALAGAFGSITLPDGGGVNWADPDYKAWRLQLDGLAPPDLVETVVTSVGAAAKDARKVEVPFERIAPEESHWWEADTGDGREGIRVALGPAGARKLQYLELGRGIAHHALIVGRTGSGKSTLLHAIITNIALTYPPSEVELYLIDFKEGVEFKTYASHELPHARVIAIESEREFGLSVLQGLQAAHKERGELFRANEVQDIADYRRKTGRSLPRILVLVDEFQGFFTEDDPIASQSRQILDMLARQGRSAGIHILLGSQTLTGDMLARSTSEQMGVRIALQCSETASRQILAEDNPGARLLSRPGEAIYNAANGLIEGNQLFQVAWLPKNKHDLLLERLTRFASARGYERAEPLVVFEGNAPADIAKNRQLKTMIAGTKRAVPERVTPVWLGEPLAIRPPVAAHFSRQTASNVLLIGQNEEAALAQVAAILISLAAESSMHAVPGAGGRCSVLDFGSLEGTHAGFLQDLARFIPQACQVVRGRRGVDLIEPLARETADRLGAEQRDFEDRYLFIVGLQRARDLRQEDDSSFSREDTATSPVRHLAKVLRDGPEVGIHTIVWCDTLMNLNRALDRRSIREFAMKIGFQMSAQDSSVFLDSPIASRLGLFRAVFQNEDEGRLEKYRPYALPSQAYLEWVHDCLRAKES